MRHTKKILTAAVCSVAASASTLAQTDKSNTLALEEVTVTAQKSTKNAQDSAVALSVISSDALTRAEVVSADQLTQLDPSLQVGTAGGTNKSFFIRGVGSSTVNSYTESAVAFSYDGVFIEKPSATTGLYYDLERVEVLKGPQGTLYGRNATGGAINVVPAKPSVETTNAYATVSVGDYGSIAAQGAVNLPVTDSSAIRMSGFTLEHDGYLSDNSSDADVQGARLQYLSEPSDNLSIRIASDYTQTNGIGSGNVIIATSATNPFTNQYVVQSSGLGNDVGPNDSKTADLLMSTFNGVAGRYLEPPYPGLTVDGQFWGVNAEIDWETSVGTLSILPAYRKSDSDDVTIGAGFSAIDSKKFDQANLEVRLHGFSESGKIEYTVGTLYFESNTEALYAPQQGYLAVWQDFDLSTESYSAFGRASYSLTDKLVLAAGLRYTEDEKSITGTSDTMASYCTTTPTPCLNAPFLPFSDGAQSAIETLGLFPIVDNFIYGSMAAPATSYLRTIVDKDERIVDSKTTYHLGLEYDLTNSSLLFATYETGFRSGGFSFSAARPSFDPEEIAALTVGSKNRFFADRLQLNLEAFYWEYEDQQVTHAGNEPNGSPGFFTENIGKSEISGLEVDVQFMATENTLLSANLLYLDAEWTDFKYNVPANENPVLTGNGPSVYFPVVTGCDSAISGAEWEIDCSGLDATHSPEFAANIGVQHTIPVGVDSAILAGLRSYFQTDAINGFDHLEAQKVDSYWSTNADITYEWNGGAYYIAAYANNIENNRHIQSSSYFATNSVLAGSPVNPRTYGIRFGASF
ncbi:TonB-dependent receptor [Microbulbifer pacificus]|uniref:TonB-dependent receptor n=1 Tax=Microbulbifer pacificus TaxID=407164 RepID=A0AAU0N1X3_9GAMM|nr:TonB-dependent receptor [Microbulbifer pacificus]WOX07029.1 TonB-dependent receptor [Microbulbifer pacificus]